MRSQLARGVALIVASLFSCLAGAQQVMVLVVGDKTTSIVDDATYSVLTTLPHPVGTVQGWWPTEDGSRATFIFQSPQRRGFNYRDPARVQVLDLMEYKAIADLPLDIGLDLAAATPDGKLVAMAFEGKKGASSLIAVDAMTGTITGRQPLSGTPTSLLFTAGSTKLLTLVAGETDEQPEDRIMGRIDLFELPALEPRGSIALPGPIAAVFWNADQSLLYALDQGVQSKRRDHIRPRRVYVIDPAAGTILNDIDLGPPSIAWDGDTLGVLPAPDHGRFYILEAQGIEVLDGKVSEVLGTLRLPHEPSGITFIDLNKAYIHYLDSGKIAVLDTANRKVQAEISTGGTGAKVGKWALIIGINLLGAAGGFVMIPGRLPGDTATFALPLPDGKNVLISNTQTWDVTVVDSDTNQVLQSFGGAFPQVLRDGHTVAAATAWHLSLYDIAEHKLLPTVALEEGGSVCPDGRHVWTGQSAFSNAVYRIDLESPSTEKRLKGVRGTVLFVVSAPKRRRMWFRRVARSPRPPGPSTALGTEMTLRLISETHN